MHPAPGTATPHVPGAPFWPDGNMNEVRKYRGAAWRHFMCPSNYYICQNWDTANILEKTSRKGLLRPEFYGFRVNNVGNDIWHGIVCQNEAILGTCVCSGMGSKASVTDFQSDPRAIRF